MGVIEVSETYGDEQEGEVLDLPVYAHVNAWKRSSPHLLIAVRELMTRRQDFVFVARK